MWTFGGQDLVDKRKEDAKRLAEFIDNFNKGLPSWLFTELHNASYHLRMWAEGNDPYKK
jgi:hypothetical protein